jgi:hypothetical protein
MDERLRQTVRERAAYRCLPQDAEPFFAYHVEHVVARQRGGTDDSGPRSGLLPPQCAQGTKPERH